MDLIIKCFSIIGLYYGIMASILIAIAIYTRYLLTWEEFNNEYSDIIDKNRYYYEEQRDKEKDKVLAILVFPIIIILFSMVLFPIGIIVFVMGIYLIMENIADNIKVNSCSNCIMESDYCERNDCNK